MFIKLTNLQRFWLIILLAALSTCTWAAGSERLSFIPLQKCISPSKSPPKVLLNKTYKIYTDVGNWQIVDINGDGLCDWVRGGYEGYRTDQETPPVREFIYLGTSTGWRTIARSDAYREAEKRAGVMGITGALSPYSEAFNFYAPFFIWTDTRRAPYVLALSRPDAPAPTPDIEHVLVMRWDETFDLLQFINGADRRKVIDFARLGICKSDVEALKISGNYLFKDSLCR
jgi:hypothetical protein